VHVRLVDFNRVKNNYIHYLIKKTLANPHFLVNRVIILFRPEYGQSTKIFNRMTGEITYGRIPAGSVVVSGNLPSKDGSHSLYCAVIIKHADEHPWK
jgi:hypothetical protein